MDEGGGSLSGRQRRVKRADCPCSVLMSDALSSDDPERVRLPGDAWYPEAAYEAALSPPLHTLGYVKVRRPGHVRA